MVNGITIHSPTVPLNLSCTENLLNFLSPKSVDFDALGWSPKSTDFDLSDISPLRMHVTDWLAMFPDQLQDGQAETASTDAIEQNQVFSPPSAQPKPLGPAAMMLPAPMVDNSVSSSSSCNSCSCRRP